MNTSNDNKVSYKSLKEFFPFYLTEHSHPINRALHFIGTSLALGFLFGFISTGSWMNVLGALVSVIFLLGLVILSSNTIVLPRSNIRSTLLHPIG